MLLIFTIVTFDWTYDVQSRTMLLPDTQGAVVMSPTTEPTRLQQELREQTRTVPGVTWRAWDGSMPWRGTEPTATPQATVAECACPVGDCIRDHEYE